MDNKMCSQDIKLNLNVFMRHRNVIDSVKDNTGLLPCKKNEKKNGEGWVMSSSCDGWQVISYRDVRSILCFSHSTVVS